MRSNNSHKTEATSQDPLLRRMNGLASRFGLQRQARLFSGLALLLIAAGAMGQGTFQNLNFEQARVPPTPVNGYGGQVDPALAFPGWTVGVEWTTTNTYALFTFYNSQALDSPAVDLIGPLFPNGMGRAPLQGSYSVVLQYSAFFHAFPLLSQTALVPADSRSISLAVPSGTAWYEWPSMSLGGVSIGLVPIGGGRLAGDVTALAGAVATLSFSTGSYFCLFDDVRFSSQPVPEPSVVGFSALGVLLVSRRMRGDQWARA